MKDANTGKRKHKLLKQKSVKVRHVSPQARGRHQTFRQEVATLHQEIFRRNQDRINEAVYGYTPAFRRYEREYAKGVQTYERRIAQATLTKALQRAQIVYVGDYHTLSQARRSFLRMLRMLPPDRPVTLALEFVEGRHQKAIDAYMAREHDEDGFLQRIKHHSHWLFGSWPSFRDIFDLARERGYRVIGIDSAGRGGRGSALSQRDRYAARRIADAWKKRPDDLVMVLTGELHIAPRHLPDEVDRLIAEMPRQRMIIYQNCERIYGALQERGLEHEVEAVQISREAYCLINTPPIVCQQSFLNWLHRDEDGDPIEEPEQTFKEYVRLIASFFDLPVNDAVDDVELTTVVDLTFLSRLRRRGDFSAHDMRLIREQILQSESYYIPRARMVYLGNLSVNHVSEEATHFLRHVCANANDPKLLVDAFYARCFEEALGFLGSKIINHKRKRAGLSYFRRLLRDRRAAPGERTLARLVLMHARMESGARVRGMAQVYECDADMFNAVTHVLGYRLGDKLYYGLVQGHLRKAEVRDLFFDTFATEGSALTTYLYLKVKTQKVRVPKRL